VATMAPHGGHGGGAFAPGSHATSAFQAKVGVVPSSMRDTEHWVGKWAGHRKKWTADTRVIHDTRVIVIHEIIDT